MFYLSRVVLCQAPVLPPHAWNTCGAQVKRQLDFGEASSLNVKTQHKKINVAVSAFPYTLSAGSKVFFSHLYEAMAKQPQSQQPTTSDLKKLSETRRTMKA